MTRNERALDRLERHSAFVFGRIERAIQQAPNEVEALRMLAWKKAYHEQARVERLNIITKIEACHAHRRKLDREREFGAARRERRQNRYDTRRL